MPSYFLSCIYVLPCLYLPALPEGLLPLPFPATYLIMLLPFWDLIPHVYILYRTPSPPLPMGGGDLPTALLLPAWPSFCMPACALPCTAALYHACPLPCFWEEREGGGRDTCLPALGQRTLPRFYQGGRILPHLPAVPVLREDTPSAPTFPHCLCMPHACALSSGHLFPPVMPAVPAFSCTHYAPMPSPILSVFFTPIVCWEEGQRRRRRRDFLLLCLCAC